MVPHNPRKLQGNCILHQAENTVKRRATSQKAEEEAEDGAGVEGGGEIGGGGGRKMYEPCCYVYVWIMPWL